MSYVPDKEDNELWDEVVAMILWENIEKKLQNGPVVFTHPVDGDWALYREDEHWLTWETHPFEAMGSVTIDAVKTWLMDPDLVLLDWIEAADEAPPVFKGACTCPPDNFRFNGAGCTCGGT